MQERGFRMSDCEFLSRSWFCVIEVDRTTGPAPLIEHGPKVRNSQFEIRNCTVSDTKYILYLTYRER
jgi:hypothetical protein